MNNEEITLQPDYKPTTGKWFLLSFQHIFAMFSATIAVPIATGLPVSTALFASGCGTLIYILCTKGKVPIYLGSSFAYIGYVAAVAGYSGETGIATNGYGAALTGLAVVGLVYVIIAIIIRFCGTRWLKKLLPPIIIGPMIIIIGLSLAGVAVGQAGLISGDNFDWRNVIVALSVLIIIAFTSLKAKGFFKIIPFVIGIGGGYIVALLLHFITRSNDPVEMANNFMNFTDFVEVIKSPKDWFALPNFIIPGNEDKELFAGISMYKVSFAAVISVIPLAFVTICEHIGDHEVLGKITGKDYLQDPGLHRTLMGDGIATTFAALIGGPANTSYGENTSVVGMTRVGSVWVTGGAAILAILLSFINIFTSFINTIPSAVIGGTCLVLYGFIASNGLKTLIDAKIDFSDMRNVIIASVMLVIGLGGAAINITETSSLSGMALAAIFGIILNLILPKKKQKTDN